MSTTSEVHPWVFDARMMHARLGSTGKDAICRPKGVNAFELSNAPNIQSVFRAATTAVQLSKNLLRASVNSTPEFMSGGSINSTASKSWPRHFSSSTLCVKLHRRISGSAAAARPLNASSVYRRKQNPGPWGDSEIRCRVASFHIPHGQHDRPAAWPTLL